MSLSTFDLSGRIAFITGSSKGIGFSIAEALAGAGATVVINSRNAAEVEAARAKIEAAGHKAHGYAFDVTDAAAVEDEPVRADLVEQALQAGDQRAASRRRCVAL